VELAVPENADNSGITAEQWRIIYENSPLGIEFYDAEGSLINANRACLEIFGVTDVSAITKFKLFDDPNLSEQQKNELLEGRTIKQEISFDFAKVREHNLYPTSKQGTIYLDLVIMPLLSPDAKSNIGYTAYVRDITLQRSAEAMLLEQYKFSEQVIDKSAVAVFVLAHDHTVVLWNRACEELTGVRAAEMIGTSNQWRPFYDEQRPTLADIILDNKHETVSLLYAKSGRSTLIPDGIRGEGWYANLNGKKRYIVFDAAPLYDTKSFLIGAIETLHDMTDFRRTEEDLERKTQELMRSNAELEHFAHIASHDLKAPLLSIAGFAEVLQDKYADRLDDKGRSFLFRIVEGTFRMDRLINDLLAYARVTSQARPFAPVACAAVLHEVLSNLKAAIDESNATIQVDDLPTVIGDKTQLVQLFQNLIGNAIKYRREASPVIRIAVAPIPEPREGKADDAREQPLARDAHRGDGRGWLFSVSDNGIGIEPRYFKEIFKIFQRIPSQEKTYSGTGIGLAVCEKIVERHGGRIRVESEPGKGTTFYWNMFTRNE
jgi:PAS domain S-box-containing protein